MVSAACNAKIAKIDDEYSCFFERRSRKRRRRTRHSIENRVNVIQLHFCHHFMAKYLTELIGSAVLIGQLMECIYENAQIF